MILSKRLLIGVGLITTLAGAFYFSYDFGYNLGHERGREEGYGQGAFDTLNGFIKGYGEGIEEGIKDREELLRRYNEKMRESIKILDKKFS